MPEAGVLTQGPARPGPDEKDAARGEAIVAAMGAVDVGQACVVVPPPGAGNRGHAWHRPDAGRAGGAACAASGLPEGGLLFKAPKPGQDRRADLPAVGPETFRAAAAAGLRGVVIEAGGVMLLDAQQAIEAADAAGLFLWIRPKGG